MLIGKRGRGRENSQIILIWEIPANLGVMPREGIVWQREGIQQECEVTLGCLILLDFMVC